VIWLIQDFDLLSVLLRALTLTLEAMTVGGAVFLLLAAIPRFVDSATRTVLCRFTSWFALALAVAQALAAAESSLVLIGTSGLAFRDVATAGFFVADCTVIVASLTLYFVLRAESADFGRMRVAAIFLPALVVLCASVTLSHAQSRLEDRPLLLLLTAAHHLGAAAWIGAMPSLLVAMRRSDDDAAKLHGLVRRFSSMALVSVAMLVLAGVGMAYFYVGSWKGMYGTSYGFMLMAKIYLLLLTLTLGASNFLLLRRTRSDVEPFLVRLRRVSEGEIGLGFTAILVGASLTSQPPAIDLTKDRLTGQEIAQRMEWKSPLLTSPVFAQLSERGLLKERLESDSYTGGSQNDAMDRAWSEYNHHWAGLIVLLAGLLALVARFRSQSWAKNWPLLFIGLAIFIVIRADPEAWPLGPVSFWMSFAEADVLQHRLFAVLITAFAFFEWAVETGRLKTERAALVFPALCAIGGALLLTHSHSLGNVKDEMLAEMSHGPIALLGATAGWSRWLELRLPQDRPQNARMTAILSWIWPISLVLAGLILLDYRES
jgi:copper resistance protein D